MAFFMDLRILQVKPVIILPIFVSGKKSVYSPKLCRDYIRSLRYGKGDLYMKATGIVRRIDDLGRVVIPKEIRRTMRIREGDPLEIFTDREGEVIFKKYSPIGEMAQFAAQYAETLYKTCGLSCVICDRDAVIACAGIPKKEYNDRKITPEAEAIMEQRQLYTCTGKEALHIVDGTSGVVSCMMPIITDGDITGCVASVSQKEGDEAVSATDLEIKLIQTAAGFLGRQLDS